MICRQCKRVVQARASTSKPLFPSLGGLDRFGVLELGAPDVIPEFGRHTESRRE